MGFVADDRYKYIACAAIDYAFVRSLGYRLLGDIDGQPYQLPCLAKYSKCTIYAVIAILAG